MSAYDNMPFEDQVHSQSCTVLMTTLSQHLAEVAEYVISASHLEFRQAPQSSPFEFSQNVPGVLKIFESTY